MKKESLVTVTKFTVIGIDIHACVCYYCTITRTWMFQKAESTDGETNEGRIVRMQFMKVLVLVFTGAIIFSWLARQIWIAMVNPPPYYEGRDWFDEDRLTDDPFDEIPLYRLNRYDYEEDYE